MVPFTHNDDGQIKDILERERRERYEHPERRFEIPVAFANVWSFNMGSEYIDEECNMIGHPEFVDREGSIKLNGQHVQFILCKRNLIHSSYWNAYVVPPENILMMYDDYVFRKTNEALPVHVDWTAFWGMDSVHAVDAITQGYPVKAWLQDYGDRGYKDIVYMYDILVKIDEMIGRHRQFVPCLNDLCIDVVERENLDVTDFPPAVLVKKEFIQH